MSGTHTTRLRRSKLFHEQDGLCFYCERPMTNLSWLDCSKTRVTTDHLIPRSEGGRRTALNEVAACCACNTRRGTMSWLLFYCIVEMEMWPRVRRAAQ